MLASPAQDLHDHGPRYCIVFFLHDVRPLETWYCWSKLIEACDLSTLLLKALAVCRRQQSESIGITLDME